MRYTVLNYIIYLEPEAPTKHGRYYGKTPILEQAQGVVRALKERGQVAFIKCNCSDGTERYYEF